MEVKRFIPAIALLLILGLVGASVVTYLSNTANATVTTNSPIELTAVALNGAGETVALDSIAIVGGDTLTITVTANNLAHVATSGKYVLTASPALETSDVSVDGTNITTGEITSVDLASTTITALGTEAKVITITVPASITPGTYALGVTYNVN